MSSLLMEPQKSTVPFLFSPPLQSAPFLRFKNANFLRFKADFINSAQMSKIFEKSLDKGHSACYYEHMNRAFI